MQAAFLFLLILFLIILGILISMLYVVRQQSVAIVERFGRYQKIATSGIHMHLPFGIDKIAARIQLRLLQSEIVVETKTKDNVFVMMNVATQYRVNEQNVTDAYYCFAWLPWFSRLPFLLTGSLHLLPFFCPLWLLRPFMV